MNIRANIWKMYIGAFFSDLMFFIPILVPFYSELGFSMHEILLIEAIFAGTCVLFEIPSGYFADVYGRKLTIFLGSALFFLGLGIFTLSSDFSGFVFGQIVMGIGVSFYSGADAAIIYETLIQIGDEKRYKKVQGNAFLMGRLGAIIAGIGGAFMTTVSLRFPFYLSMIPMALWVITNFTLVEPKIHKEKFETWYHFVRICRETFADLKLGRFIVYGSIMPAFFLIAFWFAQKYLEFVEFPLMYFGIVVAGMSLVSGLVSKFAFEIEKFVGRKMALILPCLMTIIVFGLLSQFNSFLMIPLLLITSMLWGFVMPVFQDFINKMVSSSRRATVLSIRNFMTRGLFMILAPFLGWISDLWTIQYAYLMAAGLVFIMGLIGLISLKRVGIL